MAAILPDGYPEWETQSIFLEFLIPKLPAPQESNLVAGLLDAIDMESYRVEKQAVHKLALKDEDARFAPIKPGTGVALGEADMDALSNIIKTFNAQFGEVGWSEADTVRRMRFVTDELAPRVAEDVAYQNALIHGDGEASRREHDRATERLMLDALMTQSELYKQYSENERFKRFVLDTSFRLSRQYMSGAQQGFA